MNLGEAEILAKVDLLPNENVIEKKNATKKVETNSNSQKNAGKGILVVYFMQYIKIILIVIVSFMLYFSYLLL